MGIGRPAAGSWTPRAAAAHLRPALAWFLAIGRHPAFWPPVFAGLVALTQSGRLLEHAWDEATFMLMAADVLKGHLPYVALFDNKPPFLFFVLAVVMGVFGKSLVVARLFGEFCLFATAVATFVVARRVGGALAAGVAVCVMIAAASSDLITMLLCTEYLAMPFVVAATWFAIARGGSLTAAAAAGVCMAIATLTRTNLAYVAIALGGYYALALVRSGRVHRWAAFGYAAGAVAPLAVLIGCYAAAGALDTLYLCVIGVPLSYAAAQAGMWRAAAQHGVFLYDAILMRPKLFASFTLLTAGAAVLFAQRLTSTRARAAPQSAEDARVIVLIAAATSLSMLAGGSVYRHYWSQVFPFAGIAIAAALSAPTPRLIRLACSALAAIVVVAAVAHTAASALDFISNRDRLERNDPVRRIAAAVAADRRPGDRTWALDHHLALLYLEETPLARAGAHPDNIVRPEVIGPLERAGYARPQEFERVMRSEPRYVITVRAGAPAYLGEPRASALKQFLADRYELWRCAEPVCAFRRKSGP